MRIFISIILIIMISGCGSSAKSQQTFQSSQIQSFDISLLRRNWLLGSTNFDLTGAQENQIFQGDLWINSTDICEVAYEVEITDASMILTVENAQGNCSNQNAQYSMSLNGNYLTLCKSENNCMTLHGA